LVKLKYIAWNTGKNEVKQRNAIAGNRNKYGVQENFLPIICRFSFTLGCIEDLKA
jgi:hypothetical protein